MYFEKLIHWVIDISMVNDHVNVVKVLVPGITVSVISVYNPQWDLGNS